MHILRQGFDRQFDVEDAAHAQRHRRLIAKVHAARFPDARIAPQGFGVGFDEVGQRRRADLFFTFDYELDVARQLALDGHHGVQRRQPTRDVALVVGHPACVQLAIPQGRLERRRVP